MNFDLTDEQKLIVQTTREFVEKELFPHEEEVERNDHLPQELVDEIKAKARGRDGGAPAPEAAMSPDADTLGLDETDAPDPTGGDGPDGGDPEEDGSRS